MSEAALTSFLGSLKEYDTLTPSQFGILFPGIQNIDSKIRKPEDWITAIRAVVPGIDNEVRQYHLTLADTAEEANTDEERIDLKPPTLAIQNEEHEINELTDKLCKLLQHPQVDKQQLDEFLRLNESQFFAVMKLSTSIPTTVLEKIIFHGLKDQGNFTEKKIQHFVQLGLLPKMLNPETPLRTVFPIFQKLVATYPRIISQHLLLPMIQSKVTISRPLLAGVDKFDLLSMVLHWMRTDSVELSGDLISIMTSLLDCQRKLDEMSIISIINLVTEAVKVRPTDKNLTFFFRTFVDSICSFVKPEILTTLQDINRFNQTDLKSSIDNIITKACASNK